MDTGGHHPEVKPSEREADNSPSCSAELMNSGFQLLLSHTCSRMEFATTSPTISCTQRSANVESYSARYWTLTERRVNRGVCGKAGICMPNQGPVCHAGCNWASALRRSERSYSTNRACKWGYISASHLQQRTSTVIRPMTRDVFSATCTQHS
jgi:hypothetical protein